MHTIYPVLVAAGVALSAMLFTTGCPKSEPAPVKPVAPPAQPGPVFDMSGGGAQAAQAPDAPLVTVEGKVLTRGAADAMAERMLRSQGAPEQQMQAIMQQMGPRLQARMMDQFVATTLLQKEAEKRAIKTSDAEVESALSNITSRLPPGTDLTQALAQMGVDVAQVRQEIRDNEAIRKLYQAETAGVAEASDEAVAAYYAKNSEKFTKNEEVQARHILIGCKEDEPAEKQATAKSKAEGLRKQLIEGADFAALAAANSDCPSKSDGGSLGSFGRGSMVPAFETAAFALATNAISEVVQTPFGYHVIQVTGRTAAGVQPLDQVRGELRTQLTSQNRNQAFETFIQGLRAKASIVYAEGAAPAPSGNAPAPAGGGE